MRARGGGDCGGGPGGGLGGGAPRPSWSNGGAVTSRVSPALPIAVGLAVLALAAWLLWRRKPSGSAGTDTGLPPDAHALLRQHVRTYATFSRAEQARFRERCAAFLAEVRVSGAGFTPDGLDGLLVAASAQLLLFRTDEWRLPSVREVLLHPTHFGEDGRATDPDEDMLGMVGEELFSRTVILSRADLHAGFAPGAEVHVGVHEFAHVLDRADGAADGCPSAYLPPGRIKAWRRTIAREAERALAGAGVLDEYAAEDPAELFAVATEHYFLYPDELRHYHRDLWSALRGLYG